MPEEVEPNKRMYVRDAQGMFVCSTCDKRTARQNTMHYHMRRHAEDFAVTCSACGKGFLQRASYEAHARAAHAGTALAAALAPAPAADLACPAPGCTHSCRTKANLIVHVARTHCREWLPAYTEAGACAGCGREHASAAAYLYHAAKCLLPAAAAAAAPHPSTAWLHRAWRPGSAAKAAPEAGPGAQGSATKLSCCAA